jgi:UDP-N-acetylglucosamine:LPS N-acetylglucosamine transferase
LGLGLRDPVVEICEKIWKLEADENLLTSKVQNVCFWKLIRFSVFIAIAQNSGVQGESHPALKHRNIVDYLYIATSLLLRNPHLRRKKSKRVLIMPQSKKGRDPYHDPIIRAFADEALILYARPCASVYKGALDLSYNAVGAMLKKGVYVAGKKSLFAPDEKHRLQKLEELFKVSFGVDVPIVKLAQHSIWRFKHQYKAYKNILRWSKPEIIYLNCSYGKEALIFAAQEKQIPVYEVQHGTITKYHMGYSYPFSSYVPYTPDFLLCFGSFWQTSAPLPGNIKSFVIGSSHFDALKLKKTKRKENNVLVISQGPTGQSLFKMAVQAAALAPAYRFYYLPHPSEFSQTYHANLDQRAPENFRVLENQGNILELLSKASLVLGVNSTAIFEGMALGCRTILANLAGIEYMRDVIDAGDVLLAHSAEEIAACLPVAKPCSRPEYYFSPPVDNIHEIVLHSINSQH